MPKPKRRTERRIVERISMRVTNLEISGLNDYDILRYKHLMLVKEAVPKIEAALLGKDTQSA